MAKSATLQYCEYIYYSSVIYEHIKVIRHIAGNNLPDSVIVFQYKLSRLIYINVSVLFSVFYYKCIRSSFLPYIINTGYAKNLKKRPLGY